MTMASFWTRYVSSFGYTEIEQNDESPETNPTRVQLHADRLFPRRLLVLAAIILFAFILAALHFVVADGTIRFQFPLGAFSNCSVSDSQNSNDAVVRSRFAYVSCCCLVRAA